MDSAAHPQLCESSNIVEPVALPAFHHHILIEIKADLVRASVHMVITHAPFSVALASPNRSYSNVSLLTAQSLYAHRYGTGRDYPAPG